MPITLTADDVLGRISSVKGQLSPLAAQIAAALEEIAGMEQLLSQVQSVRRQDMFLRAIDENLREMVKQLNSSLTLSLPREEEEPEVLHEEALEEDEPEQIPLASAMEETEQIVKEKAISVQPQGARFITMIGEIHHISDIPQTFAEAAVHAYEQAGGIDALIRIPSGGQRKFAQVPLRFVLARGGGFMFWNNIQAARRILGELYKRYGKNQIRKSDPVSPAARKMHNRTRGRGLERVDEILARWEASIEADAAKFRIEVISELIVRFLTAVFDEEDIPATRDEAFVHAFDEWHTVQLIIPQYGEKGDPPKTYLRTLQADIGMSKSYFVDTLGWVITQLDAMRQGNSPAMSKFVEAQLQTALRVMRADESDHWAEAINILWRRYQVLESEVAAKVTKFTKD